MGCRDQESNWNNHYFHDGKWWVGMGWDYTYDAPSLELIKERLGDHLAKYRVEYNEQTSRWKATPLKEEELVNGTV
jgi:hypothetical protein